MGTWSTTAPEISGDWTFLGQSDTKWPGWNVTVRKQKWNPGNQMYETYIETVYISFGMYTKNYVARTKDNCVCLCTDIYTRYGGDSDAANECTVSGYAKDETGAWVTGPGIKDTFGSKWYSRGKLYYTLAKTYKLDTVTIGAIFNSTYVSVSGSSPKSIGAPLYLKVNGVWAPTVQWLKSGGKWVQIDSMQLKVSDAWKS